MGGRQRKDIRPGLTVDIVLKQDEQTGRLTRGVVKEVLTKSPVTRTASRSGWKPAKWVGSRRSSGRISVANPRPSPREAARKLPEGFRYRPDLIAPSDESSLVASVRELPFRGFEFHGYTVKRWAVSFGWHYDFTARHLRKADDIPDFLLRRTAAAFAGLEPAQLQHVLVTEYGAGAAIG